MGRFRLMLFVSILCTCISLTGWIIAAMANLPDRAMGDDRAAAAMTGAIAAVCWSAFARKRADQHAERQRREITGIEMECRDALVKTLAALSLDRHRALGKTVPLHRAPWQ